MERIGLNSGTATAKFSEFYSRINQFKIVLVRADS